MKLGVVRTVRSTCPHCQRPIRMVLSTSKRRELGRAAVRAFDPLPTLEDFLGTPDRQTGIPNRRYDLPEF